MRSQSVTAIGRRRPVQSTVHTVLELQQHKVENDCDFFESLSIYYEIMGGVKDFYNAHPRVATVGP